jgi:hypothetical protein
LTKEELAGLEQMLELLEATKAWHRREGRSWEDQREIAGYRDCGWHSNYWQARRNLFGDTLTSQASKGTWITDPRLALKDLWYDVKCGKKKPALPRGQGAAYPSHEPQRAPETTP